MGSVQGKSCPELVPVHNICPSEQKNQRFLNAFADASHLMVNAISGKNRDKS